jgi:hypothetical protein
MLDTMMFTGLWLPFFFLKEHFFLYVSFSAFQVIIVTDNFVSQATMKEHVIIVTDNFVS